MLASLNLLATKQEPQKSKVVCFLAFVFLLSVALKLFLVSNHAISFWFDQSRDAHVSRSIIANKDLKILGPSASGTNDTVYHGVLYYYFLAPFYYFGGGNPFYPTAGLIILGSLAIFPLFILTKRLTNSAWQAGLATILFAFSAEATQLMSWLSNPSLAVLPIVVFYWSVWEVFYQKQKRFIWLMAFSLGILHQSAVWMVYFWAPIIVGLLFLIKEQKVKVMQYFQTKHLVQFISIFIVTTGSMLVAQLKLFKAGIFTLEELVKASSRTDFFHLSSIYSLFDIYLEKILRTLIPTWPVLALLIFIGLILQINNFNKKQRYFLLSWIFAPILLFLFHFRASSHILIGVEIATCIVLSQFITELKLLPSKIGKRVLALFLVSVYLISQIKVNFNYRRHSAGAFSLQQGSFLKQQLALIDQTYHLAQQQPFSVATYTNPYGYNITWSYLYNWYGQAKYGYTPTYSGPTQKNLFGSDLLSESDSIAKQHFYIIEPEVGAAEGFLQKNINEQNQISRKVNEFQFGTLRLQQRVKRP